MDGGAYHLVYQQNEDFQLLRAGGTFAESLRGFAEQSVYPLDRPLVLALVGQYIEDFFSRGMMKRSQRYRVLHRASGEYVWYEATALRVDIDDPKSHKALLIWKQLDQPVLPCAQTVGAPMTQNLLLGVQQCLNDQWFTLTYVNEGFISLLGYSAQELRERFQNRYIELVHPDDRLPMRRRFLEQLSSGDAQELEYRVVPKNGRSLWVLEKCQRITGEDGREYCNCILTDITQIKQAQEEQRLAMERYRIIQDQTNDITFEADIETQTVGYSPNWEKKFGYPPLSRQIVAQLPTASHLFPEDIPPMMELMRAIASGEPYREMELRIANAAGRYLWCRVRVTTQFNDAGRPVRAVGVLLDIDAEKRRTQELTDQVRQDGLTGLCTKSAAGEIIRRSLGLRDPSDRFALLIIDLDNFKQVNDTRGHMFGDAVLAQAAARLKALFRAGDVVARFGGDEFLVFLQYGGNGAFLRNKAANVVQAFHSVFPEELQDLRLTCSVGVARCPEDGTDFQTLFQHGDRALYQAKQRGKDQYALYDDATMSRIFGLNAARVLTAGTRVESDGAADYSIDSIVPQAFQKLYASGDIETAINAILEMVGRRYNVSRVYIFEDAGDGDCCRNTFEWCNEGILPEISLLQCMPYGPYRENFDENGVFYCPDISKLPRELYDILAPQGIRSLLQCAVRDGGRFAGFVGFDDCVIQRLWTQNQIDALTFIAELLSTFLLKKRAQDRALASARDLRMALDNQNSWIYVIQPDSYTLQYINAKTQRTVPDARLGMRCYEAFFHRDAPCGNCPAREIRSRINQTLEVYNPILKVWSLADASLIRWSEQDACLLACHDITDYKLSQGAGPEPAEPGGRRL